MSSHYLQASVTLWETGALLQLSNASRRRTKLYMEASEKVEEAEQSYTSWDAAEMQEWSWPDEVVEAIQQLQAGEAPTLWTQLNDKLGPHAADVLRVTGIGPKLAKAIHKTLNIRSLAELKEAFEDGRLLKVKGIGPKLLEQLGEEIESTIQEAQQRQDTIEALKTAPQPKKTKSQASKAKQTPAQAPKAKANPAKKAKAQPKAEVTHGTEAPIGVAETVEGSTDVVQRIGAMLRCPISHQVGLINEHDEAYCPTSGCRYPIFNQVIDFVQGGKRRWTPFQGMMESRLYSRFYEELFRPGLTRFITARSIQKDIEISVKMLAPKPDWVVLDVACGTGNYTRAIARQIDPDRGLVIGLDLSKPMLRRARTLQDQLGLSHVRYVRGNAMNLPLADDSVDALNCTGAFHALPDPEAALREFSRVLKPGGKLVIGTFIRSDSAALGALQRASGPLTGFRWFDHHQLLAHVETAGFRFEQECIDQFAISIAAQRPS